MKQRGTNSFASVVAKPRLHLGRFLNVPHDQILITGATTPTADWPFFSQRNKIAHYDIESDRASRHFRATADLRHRLGSEDCTMPMEAGDIERLIKAAIPDAEVTIKDLAGDGDHYAAHVISSAFRGKTRVQQHQLVYQALGGRMGDVLHALALTTKARD